MLTEEQLKTLGVNLKLATSVIGNIAGGINPGLIPFVVLGKAISEMVPGLIENVQNIITKKEPTPENSAALIAKIKTLIDPDPDSIR